jgi:hypothetical protein
VDIGTAVLEQRRKDESVMNDVIGLLESAKAAQSEQFGIARPGTDE